MVIYYSLDLLADNLEMIVNEDYILFKYLCDNEHVEQEINYFDIDSLSLSKYDYGYFLSIESNRKVFELTIDINDCDKINKCESIYNNVLPIITGKHKENELDIKFNKDSEGQLTEFYINKIPENTKSIKTLGSLIPTITMFILAVMMHFFELKDLIILGVITIIPISFFIEGMMCCKKEIGLIIPLILSIIVFLIFDKMFLFMGSDKLVYLVFYIVAYILGHMLQTKIYISKHF